MPVMATGLSLAMTNWGVVVEQPQAILNAVIKRKLWLVLGLLASVPTILRDKTTG